MTQLSPIAQLAKSCILDLSKSSEDLDMFVSTFFDRKDPDLSEDDRRRVLTLAYEFCWSRAEALQQDALNLATRSEETMDLETILQALGHKRLSDGYFDMFKRIGAYLIEKQKEDEVRARPH
ncbi:MAG TPA: hypothetical protein VHL98_02335 [Microvirga sp.]|jgi:hypothetical protein|nr:hypothetical protein [Microvirga sp.]